MKQRTNLKETSCGLFNRARSPVNERQNEYNKGTQEFQRRLRS